VRIADIACSLRPRIQFGRLNQPHTILEEYGPRPVRLELQVAHNRIRELENRIVELEDDVTQLRGKLKRKAAEMSAGEAGAEESVEGKTEIWYDDDESGAEESVEGKTEIWYDDDESGAEESVSDEERRNCRVDEKKTNKLRGCSSAAGRQEGYV